MNQQGIAGSSPISFLVGLEAADKDAEAVGDLLDVGDAEGNELGAAEGAGKGQHQQRWIAQPGSGVRIAGRHHPAKLLSRDPGFVARTAALPWLTCLYEAGDGEGWR